MLGIMRKYQKSIVIKVMFIIIVLSFIGTIFLIWGRGEKGLDGAGYAVKVNGTRISFQEVQQSYDRIKQMFSGNLTPEQEKMLGLRKLAIDSLIDAALVRKEAKRMGVKVSKDEVVAEIEKIPAFQRDGVFNFQQYQMVLRNARTTPEAFEEGLRDDMFVRKARKTIEDGVKVSDEEALQAYHKQHDKVDLVFTSYSPSDVQGEVKLSRQDLDMYLQAHQAQFRTPEQVSVSYIFLDPSKEVVKGGISEQEAESYYSRNIDRYRGKEGILPYEKVKDRVKADAAKLAAVKQAYERAADAINRSGKGGLKSVAQYLSLPVSDTPLFTAQNPPAAFASEGEVISKAFSVQPGEVGGPIESKRGIYILSLRERKPAEVPPLEAVKAAVEKGAREEKAQTLAQSKAQEALAKLAKGETAGIKLQETGLFGYSTSGDIPKIGKAPQLMETAFTLTTAQPAPKAPAQLGNRWYALKLKNRVEGDTSNFQRNKEQIKQLLVPQKQKEALQNWVTTLRKNAKIEINPALMND